ncbi:hypothetical protein BV22DRAFT_1028500 [Leucogyrophana mollusca]|uniref:Uncharacterized protein n=1 Tax=Leucogyrophana mollusca TaxID=85980 RepID=A0ACB8BWE0_9AGAM|nr:hypothetical protein BV22DRAFT_1028500 [Leucogyrophana mollusca]
MELEALDIEMDLLPAGMERRKANQSTWDAKHRTALLTIEFKFHPPSSIAPQEPIPPFSLLTHRNSIDNPLLSLIQQHVADRSRSKKESTLPSWMKTLVHPDPEDPEGFAAPQCCMNAFLDPLTAPKGAYYRFDSTQPLLSLLRGTHFVEYPTIEIWEEGAFAGTVVNTKGSVTQHADERKPKRRKLSAKAGRKAISGLLGGYGSDDDSEEQENNNGLSLLGTYGPSDDDISDESEGGGEEEPALDAGDGEDEEAEDAEEVLDPAVLLELIKHAQGLHEADGEDTLDWGDEDWEGDEPS